MIKKRKSIYLLVNDIRDSIKQNVRISHQQLLFPLFFISVVCSFKHSYLNVKHIFKKTYQQIYSNSNCESKRSCNVSNINNLYFSQHFSRHTRHRSGGQVRGKDHVTTNFTVLWPRPFQRLRVLNFHQQQWLPIWANHFRADYQQHINAPFITVHSV